MTPPTPFPTAYAFSEENFALNAGLELLKSMNDSGITNPLHALGCLWLCRDYNDMIEAGGIPGEQEGLQFAAGTPLKILTQLSAVVTSVGKPDHAMIRQAIQFSIEAINFRMSRDRARVQVPTPGGIQ